MSLADADPMRVAVTGVALAGLASLALGFLVWLLIESVTARRQAEARVRAREHGEDSRGWAP